MHGEARKIRDIDSMVFLEDAFHLFLNGAMREMGESRLLVCLMNHIGSIE
jgi:hypothetical protein